MVRSSLLALPIAFASALAQGTDPGGAATPPSPDYALTNVRIVTGPGRVIDRGTVLTRDGRIAAVGANVTIPAGVIQLNLAGHTVYPGLIDAATSIGLPSPNRPVGPPATADAGRGAAGGRGAGGAAGGRAGGGGAATPAPVTPPEIDAAAEAASMFAPTPDELNALRSGGVTTVSLVFNGGLFPGRVGVALTGGRDESRLALKPSAGQVIAFGTRRGGYPSTGIGAYAYVRQSILDAQYEARLERAFKAGTPGARPSNDPFTRALIPVASGEMQAWFVASTERQLERISEIAAEMKLKNPIVVGAQEGWRGVQFLKSAGATAVVSLEWPNANAVTGRAFATTGSNVQQAGGAGAAGMGGPPPADPSATAEVRANASALAKAGIPVILSSFGGASGATFRDRIKATVDAGMSAEEALRAATVAPAALLGVTSAVGTIEPGKLANLVVVNGNDLFGSPIKHVLVEGRLYDPTTGASTAPTTAPTGRGRGGSR